MRKVKLYIAISLDGFIADKDGKIEWLTGFPNPTGTDYGYEAFLATIDTTLIGHTTYRDILQLADVFPYPDKTNYVFTADSTIQHTEYIQFINPSLPDFIKELKAKPGKDIWLVGGGILNGKFLEADLIDEIIIHQMPVVLGEGVPLFGKVSLVKSFSLTHHAVYETGVLELTYIKIGQQV